MILRTTRSKMTLAQQYWDLMKICKSNKIITLILSHQNIEACYQSTMAKSPSSNKKALQLKKIHIYVVFFQGIPM